MANYQDTATRWADVALGRDKRQTLRNDRMPVRGDHIFSYGSHFEIARLIRDRKGEPSFFLINGETFSNTTTKHQGEVRAVIARTRMPSVIIPHGALEAAGIRFDSIQLIQVQRDWNEHIVTVRKEFPREAEWSYETETIQGTCVYVHRDTGEVIETGWRTRRPGEPHWRQTGYDHESWDDFDARKKAWESEWITYPGVTKQTGRKVIRNKRGWMQWDMRDDGNGGIEYVNERDRHRLGGSLIRARVQYMGRSKCTECNFTGLREWVDTFEGGYGPLSRAQDKWFHDYEYTEPGWDGPFRERTVSATREMHICPTCRGTRWMREQKERWGYFLSGFDENETRPSYFFCELAPGVRPTSIAEAMDSLKPESVKFAESLGREVKRQGDIFAIPMPGTTLAMLKQDGGRHIKRPHVVIAGTTTKYTAATTNLAQIAQEARNAGIALAWSGPRPQLLGTNHEGTEVVLIGGATYARGSLRHVPQGRRPDHKLVPLGKQWHLIQKNTVPVAS